LVLRLDDGQELRYHDARDMGKVYVVEDLKQVPGLTRLGPEATDPDLTLELFRQRLRRHRGEIKRVLTSQTFVSGIGNAYADEICWRAHLYPFRRRASLAAVEVAELHAAVGAVLGEAIETLRERVGEAGRREVRDFMAVHGKPGQPCPRCGAAISEVKRARRATHFCRSCQPGLLVDGR
jgi:formamidopyrimidine-DNA glycosylase